MSYFPLIRAPISLGAFLVFPFYALLIIGIIFPSDGSHGLFTPKSLAFLAAVLGAIIHLCFTNKLFFRQIKAITFVFSFGTFLLIWLGLNIFYDQTPLESGTDQFKLFWITLTTTALAYYFLTEKLIKFQKFLKTIIYANFLYSMTKIILILLHVLHVIDMWSLLEKLGIRFMSMSILGGLDRLQTSVDIVTPFFFFFFLQAGQFGITWSKKFRIFYTLISIIAVFFSFSRFLMGVMVFATLFHILAGKITTAIRTTVVLLVLIFGFVVSIGFENSALIVEKRLFSRDNYISDRTRHEQSQVLLKEHEKNSLLGKGLGGFAEDLIRDPLIRHSYEVQWLAFLMQFGLIGVCFLFLPILIIVIKILSFPITRQKLALFLMFGLWLFSGFTNPFLISLASGIMYSLFLLAGMELNIKNYGIAHKLSNLESERALLHNYYHRVH